MNTIISAHGLTKTYGGVAAVDGLTLEVARGEFFGFLGPNGAGKTTTIRMLTGMIRPDAGEVRVDGRVPGEKSSMADAVGVVPESRGFYDWMTAHEYLAFFASLYGVSDHATRIAALLDKVGLRERTHDTIKTFSRGMKQRLGLARALINDPKVLFLDEPTLGLDPQGQEAVQRLLRELNASGVTVFFSSHLLEEVADLCSRVGIIDHGRLVAQGTVAELRSQAGVADGSLKDAFLALTDGRI
jgi:ABC-2 type transport system ATP-binding protein